MALYGTLVIQAITSIGLRTAAAPAFAALRAFRVLATLISYVSWIFVFVFVFFQPCRSAHIEFGRGWADAGEDAESSDSPSDSAAAPSANSNSSAGNIGIVRGIWHSIVEDLRGMDQHEGCRFNNNNNNNNLFTLASLP